MTPVERKNALKIARESLEMWVKEKKRYQANLPNIFKDKRGCFVTLKEDDALRGCIGFPEPVLPLGEALGEAARATSEDPRFPPVKPKELSDIKIEISVLTVPKLFAGEKKELPNIIKIGVDGLIMRRGFYSGLLLPQVATEWHFGKEEFLDQTCIKAGLNPGEWLDKDVQVYTFQAEVFSEKQ